MVLFLAGLLLNDDESDVTPASDFYGTNAGENADGSNLQGDEADIADTEPGEQSAASAGGTGKTATVTEMDSQMFMSKVADYNSDKNNYIGDMPCVVDFYAEWCGPCKQLSPIMDKMAKKYAGRVKFYKIDIDANSDVSDAYGIQSIPTIFFCSDGEINSVTGAPDQSELDNMISSMCQ